jgi:hypothetical protein
MRSLFQDRVLAELKHTFTLEARFNNREPDLPHLAYRIDCLAADIMREYGTLNVPPFKLGELVIVEDCFQGNAAVVVKNYGIDEIDVWYGDRLHRTDTRYVRRASAAEEKKARTL